jgi:hypothetical protein
MWFARESHKRLCRYIVPQFYGPIYKGIFPDICSLFPAPNFPIVVIPAQITWSL